MPSKAQDFLGRRSCCSRGKSVVLDALIDAARAQGCLVIEEPARRSSTTRVIVVLIDRSPCRDQGCARCRSVPTSYETGDIYNDHWSGEPGYTYIEGIVHSRTEDIVSAESYSVSHTSGSSDAVSTVRSVSCGSARGKYRSSRGSGYLDTHGGDHE